MKYSNEKKDLAAALRWFARLDMNEGIANHFSLAVSNDGQEFLMNPAGKYWSKIKSSDILELDARKDPKNIGPVVDETAWCIHGAIHRQVPSARCVMHLHPKYATALSCLEDPKLPAINQESMTFYNRVSYDLDYGGLGIGDEGERLASKLGNHSVLMMGQHGVLVTGKTVGEAFDRMYYFERSARIYITALQTGQKLKIASHEIAEKTAQQSENYFSDLHFKAILEVLDEEEPDYLN
tara:strand:+ start:101 stop:814 length:714 start_codon:yes stop_codon:yes gene_type:complete